MHLYNLTLSKTSAVILAVFGNFSEPKAQEFAVSRGKILEMYKILETGKLQCLCSSEVFGLIRSMKTFRLPGGKEDYLIIGSDSGRLVILKFDKTNNQFTKVHQLTYGKTGCRRIVPGQYMALDPRGRALLLGAVEKQKLVFVLNRDMKEQLTISSPLEAHKSHELVLDIAGIDNGYDNPIFASLEYDYTICDEDSTGDAYRKAEKQIVYYELDLGLNNVIKKWSTVVDRTSNMIITLLVPRENEGEGFGASGVLVCSEDYISFVNQDHGIIKAKIPKRQQQKDSKVMITCQASLYAKKNFLLFVQSEFGDLYKVIVDSELTETGLRVKGIEIKYFDTLPVAKSMIISTRGCLVLFSESGNHYCYHITDIDKGESSELFIPHLPQNLDLVDEIPSIAPCTQIAFGDLANEGLPQIYSLTGKGSRSSLRVLRHGLSITELAVQSMPGKPFGIWSVKKSLTDAFDSYILVSFNDATIILEISDSVVEVKDSKFMMKERTFDIKLLDNNEIVQIHSGGIRNIQDLTKIKEWKPPNRRLIKCGNLNNRQAVIALDSGIFYFELSSENELEEIAKIDLDIQISCICLSPIPEGRQRAPFIAAGSYDSTVHIYSIQNNNNNNNSEEILQESAIQAVSNGEGGTLIHSVCINLMNLTESIPSMFLNIGLDNGFYERNEIDMLTGKLSDKRTRLVGTKPVTVLPLTVDDQSTVIVLSSKPWLSYTLNYNYRMAPISYTKLDYCYNFHSEHCPDGIVAISDETLRIFTINRIDNDFNQTIIPLTFTPRKLLINPQTNNLIILQTEPNSYSYKQVIESFGDKGNALLDEDTYGKGNTVKSIMGVPKPNIVNPIYKYQPIGSNIANTIKIEIQEDDSFDHWGSCIQMIDPKTLSTLDIFPFENDEAALSACLVEFHDRNGEIVLVVGTSIKYRLFPKKIEGGKLYVFRILSQTKFQLLHVTEVEGLPSAMCQFQGRLLVGIEKTLRIYDLGKRKLLRKCENRSFPHYIATIHTMGDRIYIGDSNDGFQYVKFRKTHNQLVIYADDVLPRFTTCAEILDYNTMVGCDKFGNIYGSRVSGDVQDDIDNPTGTKIFWDNTSYLNSAPNKLDLVFHFYTGETVTSINKGSLVPGRPKDECLIYSTILGSIAALKPLTTIHDQDFFLHLEMFIRQYDPSLVGREQLHFRSTFVPVKDVIDGDLCELYPLLKPEIQRKIASELQRSVGEVIKKLEDIRNQMI